MENRGQKYCRCTDGFAGKTCSEIKPDKYKGLGTTRPDFNEPVVFDFYKTKTPEPNLSTSSVSLKQTFTILNHDQLWPSVSGSIAVIAFFLAIGYALWKRNVQNWGMTTKFDLIFDFHSRTGSVFIRILEIYGHASDYIVEGITCEPVVQIEGIIFPKLIIVAPIFSVHGIRNSEIFRIPNKINLHWYQTYRLRRIMRAKFNCLPGFSREGLFTNVVIHEPQTAANILIDENETLRPLSIDQPGVRKRRGSFRKSKQFLRWNKLRRTM